jgi:hypothetical protein
MAGYDPDNRFSKCVAEYRKEKEDFFNRSIQSNNEPDNRFSRCVAEERSLRAQYQQETEYLKQTNDRFRCLKDPPLQQERFETNNRFSCLRDPPENRFECLAEGYDRRRSYSDQDIRQPVSRQTITRPRYESVNTTLQRMKESGELQVTKWEPRSQLERTLTRTSLVSSDVRKPRSKTSLSVDDIEQFPSLGGGIGIVTGVPSKIKEQPKLQNAIIEEIIEKNVEPEFVAIHYSKGKMVETPMYKDSDGNLSPDKPVEKRIIDVSATYTKWSDLLKK